MISEKTHILGNIDHILEATFNFC